MLRTSVPWEDARTADLVEELGSLAAGHPARQGKQGQRVHLGALLIRAAALVAADPQLCELALQRPARHSLTRLSADSPQSCLTALLAQ